MTPKKNPIDLQTVGTVTAIFLGLASLWSNYADPVEAELKALRDRILIIECKLGIGGCK